MTVFDSGHRADHLPARIALTFIENGNATLNCRTCAARRHGLPTLQASLLIQLRSADGDGGTVGALADVLQLTPPTISDSLKALVRKGFISRRRSERDGRVAFFRLTPKGRRTADRLMAWADPIEEVIIGLTPEHQLALLATLTRLLRRQVEGGFIPAERMCASCAFFDPVSWDESRYYCRRRDEPIPLEDLRIDCPNHRPLNGSGR